MERKSRPTAKTWFPIPRSFQAAGVGLVVALLGSAPAVAQAPASPGSEGQVAVLAFFLDSIHTQPMTTGQLGITASRRRSPDGTEWMIPALHLVYGVTERLDFSFSVPYSRGTYGESFRVHGLGDRYISAKLRLRDATDGQLGVAVEPTLEVLGEGSLAAGANGPGKHNLALPVILQRTLGPFNVFGETGYISRGAVFAGLGVDTALAPRLGVGVNLLWSWATGDSPLNQQYGLLRSRTDVLVGAYYVASPRWTVLVSGGRTVSALDPNGTRNIVNVGLNYTFQGP